MILLEAQVHCATSGMFFSLSGPQFPHLPNGYINFPEGQWVEILNTDDKKYGGTGNYNNVVPFHSNGYDNSPIKLAGQSTKIFKRIG